MAFEIIDMNLDERGKLRRMLADHLSQGAASAEPDPTAAPAEAVVSRR
jgi:hypothetical protein